MTVFKLEDLAVVSEEVARDTQRLRKVVGTTRCDIMELQSGLLVKHVEKGVLTLQHPRDLSEVTVPSRYFRRVSNVNT